MRNKASNSAKAEALDAVEELKGATQNEAATYTFDITVYDKEGNEIEPDRGCYFTHQIF